MHAMHTHRRGTERKRRGERSTNLQRIKGVPLIFYFYHVLIVASAVESSIFLRLPVARLSTDYQSRYKGPFRDSSGWLSWIPIATAKAATQQDINQLRSPAWKAFGNKVFASIAHSETRFCRFLVADSSEKIENTLVGVVAQEIDHALCPVSIYNYNVD